jgi:hypothetical protein
MSNVTVSIVPDGQHRGYFAAKRGATTVYGSTKQNALDILDMIMPK